VKLTVATSFSVFPPRGGGQARVYGLYAALAATGVEVDVVALVGRAARGGVVRLAPGLRELRVPKTAEHEAREAALLQAAGAPVTDVLLARDPTLTPAYGEAIAASAADADAVVASHPYAEPALAAATRAPLVYEAHNVEADLKRPLLASSEAGDALLAVVAEVEAACCARAEHVTVCSPEDGARLGALYGLDPARTVAVPNGVDPDAVPFAGPERRAARRARLGLADAFHAVFVGSWHEPNRVAALDVLAAARATPELRYLVLGSVGETLAREEVPANVDVCGVVDDAFLAGVLGFADAALNPMRWGSGTNLKMLHYALAGAPLVASPFGARGLGLAPGVHYRAAEPDALAEALRALRAEPAAAVAERARAAARLVRERFAWEAIARAWRATDAFRALEPLPAVLA